MPSLTWLSALPESPFDSFGELHDGGCPVAVPQRFFRIPQERLGSGLLSSQSKPHRAVDSIDFQRSFENFDD
jgi:hypothetical protein